jgi:hypothetical protein
VILESLTVAPAAFAAGTGWEIKPEGACKDGICVPLGDAPFVPGTDLDVRLVADRLGMPLVHDEKHDLWALGPERRGHALPSAKFPDLVLPTWHGEDFDFRSLRGQKIFLLAWASW